MGKKSREMLVLQFLWENTDEHNPVTIKDMQKFLLEEHGINATRTTLYQDIACLQEHGFDIFCDRRVQNQYYIDRRILEVAEVKLLVDAVQASRMISRKRSKNLIKKLSNFVSTPQAGILNRQLHVDESVKPVNECVIYIVDEIHEAIRRKNKVTFQYFEYNQKKKRELKHEGQFYMFSPYALVWNEDFYYAIGYSDNHDGIAKFRVDRMTNLSISEERSAKKPQGFKLSKYLNQVFSMYDGNECEVILRCENEMMKHIIDRFGENVKTKIMDEEHFEATVKVYLSSTFFGWVLGFDGKIQVVGPTQAVREFRELLDKFSEK